MYIYKQVGMVPNYSSPLRLKSSLKKLFSGNIKAQEKGVQLGCLINPDVPYYIKGDPGRLRQILLNLAGNATKFTSEGEVVIRVSLADQQVPEKSTVKLKFDIIDTGIGIPKNKHDQLFKFFSQVDATTTRKFGGTGLGLAISKKLTEIMDGEIGVESEEGEGSTFWFTAVFEKDSAKQPGHISSVDITGRKILCVNNNSIDHEIFNSYLTSWACRFTIVSTAEKALEALRLGKQKAASYECVIIDDVLPDMDGRQLGRIIKSDRALNTHIMVLISSKALRGEVNKIKDIGFSAFLSKPIRQYKLYECLSIVFGSSQESQKNDPVFTTNYTLNENKKKRPIKILMAEDNPINQKITVTLLNKLGYDRVDTVANGKEAIEVLENINYDLILMDGSMPEMSGIEASIKIREDESKVKNRLVPIIAMTAHAMEGDKEKFLDAGMNDYIKKPFYSDKLAQVIERVLANTPPSH